MGIFIYPHPPPDMLFHLEHISSVTNGHIYGLSLIRNNLIELCRLQDQLSQCNVVSRIHVNIVGL